MSRWSCILSRLSWVGLSQAPGGEGTDSPLRPRCLHRTGKGVPQRFRDREPARGVLACPCIELVLECPSLFGFEVDGREKLPEEP